MYYTSLDSFLRKYEKLSRKDTFPLNSEEDFLSWQKSAREKLSSLLALDLLQKPHSTLAEKQYERHLDSGIKVEHITIHVEDDVIMPMYILIPQSADCSTPVFLCPPGHMGGGKESVAGFRDNAEVSKMIDHFNYDYALKLAEEGFVAVAFDSRGFGERREIDNQGDDKILTGSCYGLAHMAEPLGFTLAGLLVWDIMRLVDYIEERGEWGEVRGLGFSGGGLQILYASALDERIRLSFISGYFYGFRDSLLILNNNCNCNFIPNLWRYYDVADIAALIAPRPLVIQSAENDHLNGPRGLENVFEPMEELSRVYSLLGKRDKLYHDVVEGPHHFEDKNMMAAIRSVE